MNAKQTVKENWKPVTIGGTTGILMGAGAMYGLQTLTATDDETAAHENGLRLATVDNGLSFGHAFEAAREQVGPGGVFRWHGHLYNTYTADEWNALSHDDQQLFAQRVKPEVSPYDVHVQSETQHTPVADPDVRVAEVSHQPEAETASQQNDVEIKPSLNRAMAYAEQASTTWEDITSDDDDVRVVGFKELEYANGRSLTMQELDINGQRVAVIDVDKDGVPDLAMSDLNHNNHMDEGEVIDLHTGETLSFSDDNMSAPVDTDSFNA